MSLRNLSSGFYARLEFCCWMVWRHCSPDWGPLSDYNKSEAEQSTPKLVTLCSATDDIISLIKNMTSSRYIVHIWCHKTLPEGFKHVHLHEYQLSSLKLRLSIPDFSTKLHVNLATFMNVISLLWQCLQAALSAYVWYIYVRSKFPSS